MTTFTPSSARGTRKRALLFCISLTCAALAGCNHEDDLGLIKVTGVVRYDGQPLTSGFLTFVPEKEGGNAASSVIADDGRYCLKMTRTRDGIPPGTYKVRFDSWKEPPTSSSGGIVAIPLKYFRVNTSGVVVTVEPGRPAQEIDLTLNK